MGLLKNFQRTSPQPTPQDGGIEGRSPPIAALGPSLQLLCTALYSRPPPQSLSSSSLVLCIKPTSWLSACQTPMLHWRYWSFNEQSTSATPVGYKISYVLGYELPGNLNTYSCS